MDQHEQIASAAEKAEAYRDALTREHNSVVLSAAYDAQQEAEQASRLQDIEAELGRVGHGKLAEELAASVAERRGGGKPVAERRGGAK